MSLYFSTVDYGMDNMRYGGSGGHRTSIGYQTLRDDNYKMDHTKWGYLNNTAFGFKCLHKTTTAKGKNKTYFFRVCFLLFLWKRFINLFSHLSNL